MSDRFDARSTCRRKCDTLNVAPGERWDVLVKAAELEHGMFGMVTALIVEKPSA